MASTTDFNPASKTYKATRPNPDAEMDFDDWIAPIGAAASGVGWGENFRNLSVQSLTIAGYVEYKSNDELVHYIKPTGNYSSKFLDNTLGNVVEGFEGVLDTLASDEFAEEHFGTGATYSRDYSKESYRAVVKGQCKTTSGSDVAWVDFTATFTKKKVDLSNYIVQGVPGPKVDEYLETLDGYKTEA